MVEPEWWEVYGFVPMLLITFLNWWVWMLVVYYSIRGEVEWRF